MGVNKSFWKWSQSYLVGRTQQVKLPGVLSRSVPVISSVPQGGVISPTFFNVHINDIEDVIPQGLTVTTCKYADGCSQYELVYADSTSHMQDVMTHLEGWAEHNKMELTPIKIKTCGLASRNHARSPSTSASEERCWIG